MILFEWRRSLNISFRLPASVPFKLIFMDASHVSLEDIASQSDHITFIYDLENDNFTYFMRPKSSILEEISDEYILRKPQQLIQLIHGSDRDFVISSVKKAEADHRAVDIEFRLFMPDQTIKWVRMQAYLLKKYLPDQKLIAGMLENITRRKEYEMALFSIKEQKDVVLQILSHDLRAPINTISMATQVLEQEIQTLENEKARKVLEIINTTCANSLRLIDDVLILEYIESQELEAKKIRTDLVTRLQNQISVYELLPHEEKKFILTTSKDTIYATIDPVKFTLVSENLLSNAYKFTGRKGRIEVRLEEMDDKVLLSVADNGIGIPERMKPLVFDKFTKARRPGNQGEKPVGLGMNIVKTMVEQLKGRIWFESQEGKGTTFFVEVPKYL